MLQLLSITALAAVLFSCVAQETISPRFHSAITAHATRDDPASPGHRVAHLRIDLGDSIVATDSGLPGFIVQVDVPSGVKLDGKPVTEFDELVNNEFLMEPWERLVEGTSADIGFTVDSSAAPGATLGIIVTGYVAGEPGKDDAFLRHRIELELGDGAASIEGNASDSSWGPFASWDATQRPLNIGDTAPTFTSPKLRGGTLDLSDHLGRSPLVVATYRGFW